MVDRWNYCLLSSVCEEITSGGAAPQGDKYFINGKYPFVRVVDMGNLHGQKYMLQTRDLLNDVGAEKLRLFPSGTILFTKSGASLLLNQRAILKVPMYVVSHIGCLIPNEAIISEWLYYWMKTVDFNIYAHATTLPSLKLTTIKELRIPVPTIPEQERIVARIEELFSQLDAGVETLKKTKAQLAVYRQAVLKEAFDNCDERVAIESICYHVTDGDHMPPPKAESGVPFIMISNINRNTIDWNNTAFVDRNYYESINEKRKPQKGDVLYTVTGSYGLPVLVDFETDFCFQRHIALLRPKPVITQKYLYYALMEPETYAQATKGATGTAQKTIGLGILRKMQIPFCENIAAQNAIVEDIENRLSVCDGIEQTVDAALQQADALRQSILNQAFKGRL